MNLIDIKLIIRNLIKNKTYTSKDKSMPQGYCDALALPAILESIPGIEDGCRVSPANQVKLIHENRVIITGNPGSLFEAPVTF